MKKKSLTFRLYIPLIVLIIVVTISAWLYTGQIDAESFLLNMSTELLGIIITIWYVDKVISQYNEEKWFYTDKLIHKRIKDNLHGILTFIAFTFDGLEEIKSRFPLETRIKSPDTILYNFLPEYAFDLGHDKRLAARVYNLKFEQVQALAKEAQKRQTGIENILDVFGKRISPAQTENLVLIQDALRKIENGFPTSVFWNIDNQDSQFEEIKKAFSKELSMSISLCIVKIQQLYSELPPEPN